MESDRETSTLDRGSEGGRRGFGGYVGRRLLLAFAAFAAQALAISAILHVQLETTERGRIQETAALAMSSFRPTPGGPSPVEAKLALIASMEKAAGLDRPLLPRIVERAARLAVLDFGAARESAFLGGRQVKSVRARILEALPRTLALFLASTLVALLAGISLGSLAAARPGSLLDRSTTFMALVAEATPIWWIGSVFILVFVYYLPLFPHGSWQSSPPPEGAWPLFLDRAAHLLLPVLSIALMRLWSVAFYSRTIILPVFHEDYVMAARGMGLPESRVILSRVLRNAAPGLATTAIQRLVTAIGGDVLVEIVFSFPGIGFALWMAIRGNDVEMAAGILSALALLFSLALALLDIFHGILDPRTVRRRGR